MSKDNNRYNNSKIYTVRYKNDNSLIYCGSTIQPLYKRWFAHKSRCYNINDKEYNKLLYQKIRETDNINDWYIELYELFPCNSKEELLKREGEVTREIGTLNKNISGRTSKQYYIDNFLKINEYNKQYYIDNKIRISNYYKEYYKNKKLLNLNFENLTI